MVKKISMVLLVIVVIAAGIISFIKLNYLERSAAIFKLDSSSQYSEGRGRRGGIGRDMYSESREGSPRQGRINIPDSLRGRQNLRDPGSSAADSYRSENLDFTRMRRDTINIAGGDFGGRNRRPDGFGGHGERRGKTISLNMVLYYLAVFALFTLITIYIEKGYRLIFKKKKLTQEDSELII